MKIAEVKITGKIGANFSEAFGKAKRNALGAAGLKLLHDVLNIPPKPPVDTGLLRGSWGIWVDGKAIDAPFYRHPEAKVTYQPGPEVDTVTVALDTPYAARLHEIPGFYWNHNKPEANKDSGPKFVESKLNRFKEDYAQTAADAMEGSLK